MQCFKFMLPWQHNNHIVLNLPKSTFFQNKFEMKEKQTCILTIDTVADDPHLV